MRLNFIIVLIVFCVGKLSAQNLISNPSFEDTVSGNFGLKYAANWSFPSRGQAEYYTIYHNPSRPEWGVPNNYPGYQLSNSGNAFIGIRMYSLYNANFKRVREYIQSQLVQPLEKDSNYCLQLYVSLADSFRYASRNQIGIHFSQTEISVNTDFHLSLTPQIVVSPNDYIVDKVNWLKFNFSYIASGGEEYIILGNFNDTSAIDTMFVDGGRKAELAYIGTYYYIDNIYFGQCDSLPQDTSIGLTERKLNYNEAKVFPNPTKGRINIEVERSDNYKLEVFDKAGRSVMTDAFIGSSTQLNLKDLTRGIYFLRVISDRRAYYQKIILKK